MKKSINNWRFVILLSLTLGLAPFVPEPHLFGKVRWILGGANDMQMMDWFDFFLHGTPFFLLFRLVFIKIRDKFKQNKSIPSAR